LSWNPISWWEDGVTDVLDLPGDLADEAGSWLSGIGGEIGSGIEAGAVAIFGDLWDVVEGPLLVLLGAVIIIITLTWALKNQVIAIGAAALL
jgi:hypothetical protein